VDGFSEMSPLLVMPPFITSVVLWFCTSVICGPTSSVPMFAVMSSVTVASAGLRMNAFSLGMFGTFVGFQFPALFQLPEPAFQKMSV
jgi:hypothetical protein